MKVGGTVRGQNDDADVDAIAAEVVEAGLTSSHAALLLPAESKPMVSMLSMMIDLRDATPRFEVLMKQRSIDGEQQWEQTMGTTTRKTGLSLDPMSHLKSVSIIDEPDNWLRATKGMIQNH